MSLNILPETIPAARDERNLDDPAAGKGIIMHNVRDFIQEMTKGLFNWSEQRSIWPLTFGIKCCAIEMMAFGAARYDSDRMGVFFRASPRQADLLIIAGPATIKLKDVILRLYEQMPEPKYVIAFGECATCGGPFWDSYSVINGVDKLIPVDVYVPGCPPRPEQLFLAVQMLQQKIDGKNRGTTTVAGMPEMTREEILAQIMAHPTFRMGHQSAATRVQPTAEELALATPSGQPDEIADQLRATFKQKEDQKEGQKKEEQKREEQKTAEAKPAIIPLNKDTPNPGNDAPKNDASNAAEVKK